MRAKWFSHLVFVEFQYTTCRSATTAEIMLKRNIVAFQARTAPGVHIGGHMLATADSLHAAWEWCVRSGKTGQRRSVTNFPQILHQQKSNFYVMGCCSSASSMTVNLQKALRKRVSIAAGCGGEGALSHRKKLRRVYPSST